ncbi:MAG: c-type cytochrome [Cytophagales bacterium]|nr:c-type cytochrome [Cytophagales bacterium]
MNIKIRNTLLGLLAAVVLLLGGLLAYVQWALPSVGPAPELNVEASPERIHRGRYLAHAVAACMDCHSTRDWSRLAAPLQEGTLGRGGERFDETLGFPGTFISPNITSFNLADWTDGEIYRAIKSGVSKEGKALFPVMPYPSYAQMDEEDVFSIIAYLRSLPSQAHEVPGSRAQFPMSLLIKTIPKKAEKAQAPPRSDRVAYGKYLLTIAACADCHTPQKQGQPLPGLRLAGGFPFALPTGTVRSSNISPSETTGIGLCTEDMFVQRFKQYADSAYVPPTVEPGGFNTVMPWLMYAQMEEEDLKAIFAYLQTVDPVENTVERFSPRM